MDSTLQGKLRVLAETLEGEIDLSLVTRAAYSTDASMYQIIPDAVFIPKNSSDLEKLAPFCLENHIQIVLRGAGTNMTGAAIGRGIIVDFSRYLNRVLDLNLDENYCVVQPGLVHGELQKELKRHGKFFPPDPSSGDYCTIGGIVANNSSGIHGVKYGDAKDWVKGIKMILSDGSILDTEVMNGMRNLDLLGSKDRPGTGKSIAAETFRLIKDNWPLIENGYPDTVKNSSGYNLKEAFLGRSLDWNKILVGSEGTLGIFSEIKLKLADIPKHSLLFLASFGSLEDSLKEIVGIVKLRPSACELLDDFLISLIMKENLRIATFLPDGTKAVLLVEFQSDDIMELEESGKSLEKLLAGKVIRIDMADSVKDQDFLWGVRRAASPITNRVSGEKKPVRFVEDLAVNPAKLPDFIRELRRLLAEHGFESAIYGHVGAGNIHLNPNIDLTDKDYKSRISYFADAAYRLVIKYKGTIGAEHGDGMLRAPFVNLQFGRLTEVFKRLKSIFDPGGIMNRGKKISDATAIDTKSLRYDYETGSAFKIVGDSGLKAEILRCHGCGTCRIYCPVASTTLDEKDSARAKLNLMKLVASGYLPDDKGTLKEVKDVIDHCFNCKQCLIKCPTIVDVPFLCSEAKRMLNSKLGEAAFDRYIGDVQGVAKAISMIAPVANYLSENHTARKIAEKITGIDARRELPEFHRAKLRPAYSKDSFNDKVVYHPGSFALYNDKSEAKATLDIFAAAGIAVKIHDKDCCYVSAISKGVWEDYLKPIRENVRILKSHVEDGYKIVTSSASCGLAMRVEYPRILNNGDSMIVSENIFDIHEYLAFLIENGFLKLGPMKEAKRAVFHNPCHLLTQQTGINPEDIFTGIEGLELVKINDSCCGIAGSFGLIKKNFDLSMRIGERLFKEILASGADFVISSCGTCKMQIEQGTGMKVVHTVGLLAELI